MLKIRLRRMGSRNHPFYRVVVSDSRRAPTASALEEIGYYDPTKTPAVVEIKRDRVEFWAAKGARMSKTVETLLASPPSPAPAAAGPEETTTEAAAPE
jgi:small subunit ribosomal protein S16